MNDTSNVHAWPGSRVPTHEPNAATIALFEQCLEMAKSGQLQSFIGTGFVGDGGRFTVWADHHENVYEMHGALGWLTAEYIHRHKEALA